MRTLRARGQDPSVDGKAVLKVLLIIGLTASQIVYAIGAGHVTAVLKVHDATGRLIGDLRQDDFHIEEDGRPVTIEQWTKSIDWLGRAEYYVTYSHPNHLESTGAARLSIKVDRAGAVALKVH